MLTLRIRNQLNILVYGQPLFPLLDSYDHLLWFL